MYVVTAVRRVAGPLIEVAATRRYALIRSEHGDEQSVHMLDADRDTVKVGDRYRNHRLWSILADGGDEATADAIAWWGIVYAIEDRQVEERRPPKDKAST